MYAAQKGNCVLLFALRLIETWSGPLFRNVHSAGARMPPQARTPSHLRLRWQGLLASAVKVLLG